MRPTLSSLVALALATLPALSFAGDVRSGPQRVEFKAPAEVAAEPAPAAPRDPELAALDAHREACQQHRIDRGGDVGGIARIGARLGSEQARAAGQMTPEVEVLMLQWDGWGAFISGVVPGSPAEDAGLIAGDVVVQYAGLWVESYPVLQRLASRSELGREYEIRFLREGVLHTAFLFPAEL